MKRLPALAGALALLCIPVQAGAQSYTKLNQSSARSGTALIGHRLEHSTPFSKMTQAQLAHYLKRQLVHDKGAIRWLSRHLAIRQTGQFSERLLGTRFVLVGGSRFISTVQRDRWQLHLRWFQTSQRITAKNLRSLQVRIQVASTPQTWLAAVDLVGRYFGDNVASWERSCSQQGSEGGWGRWVPNTLGSGAGGWLQFKLGTFNGIIDDAIVNARARGMYVPASASSWYSPLGQAIAGAQMLADGRRGEWTGWGC